MVFSPATSGPLADIYNDKSNLGNSAFPSTPFWTNVVSVPKLACSAVVSLPTLIPFTKYSGFRVVISASDDALNPKYSPETTKSVFPVPEFFELK
ncbi:hypothetical protein D3C81_2076720 [compost metagenome]